MKRRRSENICKRFYQLVLGKSYDYNERIYIALQAMKCTYCLFSVSSTIIMKMSIIRLIVT